MPPHPFVGSTPTRFVWVSPDGNDAASGAYAAPMRTIQAAVNRATPGTAIMVRSGIYTENVEFRNIEGTPHDPIWLISADGPQRARVVAASNSLSTIYGYGEDNIIIRDFEISGGVNGIQFSQSGSNFTNLIYNIVIQNNLILNAVKDGIKISQGYNVHILDNTVIGGGDQAIDFVFVNDSVIARNEVSQITGPAAIFAKGGSTNVLIADNWVHDIAVDGITVGGWTSASVFAPGYGAYEARNVTVTGNLVERVGKRPLSFLGAWDSEAYDNGLKGNPAYYTILEVGPGSPEVTPRPVSQNISIHDNVLNRANGMIQIVSGNNNAIGFTANRTNGIWSGAVGPDRSSVAARPNDPHEPAPSPLTPPDWHESTASETHRYGSPGRDILIGASRNDHLDGAAGVDSLIGGSGDDTYVVSHTIETVTEKAGGGVDTVILNTSSYRLPPNVENLTTRWASGSYLEGNQMDNILRGNRGNDEINGGDGSDLIYGGLGRDLFVMARTAGHDTVADFETGSYGDVVVLPAYSFSRFSDIVAAMRQYSNGTVLELNNSTSLTLLNIDIADLRENHFLF